jgi:predicted nuclease of restriction endonuclease-like (RecB) superfamily
MATLGGLMSDLPVSLSGAVPGVASQSYEEFLEDIKGRIRSAQARAARAISAELIGVYWRIGREILSRQAEEGDRRGRGGTKVIERLSADLRAAFPGVRGYSVSSLRYMRAFAVAWPEEEMLQSGFGVLPWGHITLLLDRLGDRPTRDWYAARAVAWSRAQRFMLALGEGFYFAGRQKGLKIGREEFFLDLLFYHHPTRRFVVIDLKIGAFQAEFAGKMNLYVNAVDKLIAHGEDRPTVGFILCADRNEAVAHLTLQGMATPIAVTRYAVGERGVVVAGENTQITAGLEEEVEGLRRVEKRVAEFAARRARELTGDEREPGFDSG